MTIERYPLRWPHGRPRCKNRKVASFTSRGGKVNFDAAVKRLQGQLNKIGAVNPVINSDLPVRLDGSPILNRSAPADPGVVVFFTLKGKPVAMPCDRYTTPAANVAAVAAHIAASRAIERHGVATMSEIFAGFTALPSPEHREPWHVVLKLPTNASVEQIEAAYRDLAFERHPDRGGSNHQMAELNRARDEALASRGAK